MTQPTDADHLRVTRTDRGFRHLPPLPSTYGGEVRAYESSAAAGPHVWLRVDEGAATGRDGEAVDATAHLTAADAWRLAEQLALLVADHYQGFARPPGPSLIALVAPPTAEEEP